MWFERLLAAIAPQRAAERAAARIRWQNLNALYDGARNTRRTRNWRADTTGPNLEVQGGLATLRARSRDLVRNNPWASAGLDLLVSYQIGSGIVPRSATGDEKLDAQVNALFAEWSEHCDLTGRHDFYGLQSLLARSRAEAGEGMALLVPLTMPQMKARKLAVPLAIQAIEPDQVDETADNTTRDETLRQGIYLDAMGQPIGYRVSAAHPGERDGMMANANNWQRWPADRVIHVYRQDRPGQIRGVPDLASVITRLRMLDELEDAALEQAKVQAVVAALITSQAPAGRGPLEGINADTGAAEKTLYPGMFERLLPGEDVKFLEPPSGGGIADIAKHHLLAVAAGFGLTYDLLTGDLSSANYSSLRAGRLAFKRRLERMQWLCLIPAMCYPVWDAFTEAAVRAAVLPPRKDGYPAKWGPPSFELLDAAAEADGVKAQLRLGLKTWPQAVAEMGFDPDEQARDIAAWNQKAKDLGLILDGDPRYTTGAGLAQDPKQNAAVQLNATGA